ncbi:MAG: DUF481 domain-containing protein [Deltaproteobacteria bacterium]|nr:DUF481 domain-containing protein [Deltaproteobacteria bacterium]
MLRIVILQLALSQTPPAPATPPPAPTPSAEESAAKAADAAQKAAEAAQRAAEAAQKAADAAAATQKAPPIPVMTAAVPAAEISPWSATAGLGFISLTGNTRSVTASATAAAAYTRGDWVFSGKMAGVYGTSRIAPDEPSQVLALAGLLQLRVDRKFTDLVAAYVLSGVETNHVKSLEYNAYGEAGVSLFWINTKKDDGSQTYLRTDLGLRAGEEVQFQYYPVPMDVPDITLVAPRLGAEFRYGLTKDLLFVQTADVMTNIAGTSQTLVNSLSKVSARLVGGLAIGASFGVAYNSAPPQGKVPTDTTLALNLDYSL